MIETKEYPDVLKVRRPFKGVGVFREKGEPFPWKELEVDPIRVDRLVQCGYLEVSDDVIEPVEEPASKPKPKPKRKKQAVKATKKKVTRKKRAPKKAKG